MSLPSQDNKVGPGAYFALAFAAVFFSGLLGSVAKNGMAYLISPR